MKKVKCAILSLCALFFFTAVLLADTSTVDVTIDAVNGEARMLTVLYGGKSNQLKVADDATIEIDGKKSLCESLVSGDKAVVTFDKQRRVITKIVATREGMKEKSDPFDSETSESAEKSTSADASSQGDGKTQTVIAEGVGTSADDAIKDAFRNAVRQVVGAIVDAETLLKNDELIDDKVLTYSGGFVKKFTEVEGSKKASGGLHRIKIKADVERQSVIEKLKAAKISVKEVDGKSMFAEVVSQLEAEKDAAALIKKQFEGFPLSYMTASVVGEPKILDKNDTVAKIQVIVRVETDYEAYKAFATKLTEMLEKMALDKGEFSGVSKYDAREGYFDFGQEAPSRWIPRIWGGYSENPIFAVAVATSRSKLGDKLECKCFQIDSKLRKVLLDATRHLINVKLEFLDSDGQTVGTERVLARDSIGRSGDPRSASEFLFQHGLVSCFQRANSLLSPFWHGIENDCRLVFVGPTFFIYRGYGYGMAHRPVFDIAVVTEVSLDELQSFNEVKVELYSERYELP